MAIDEIKFAKWLQSIGIVNLIWIFFTCFRLWDQTVYMVVVMMAIFHASSLFYFDYHFKQKGQEIRIGKKMYRIVRYSADISLFFGLCQLFLVFGPISNVLPPNIPPFTWGLEAIYYIIEAYVIFCSIETGIYGMIRYKPRDVVIPDKKSEEKVIKQEPETSEKQDLEKNKKELES
jgi:hypothetical protein